MADIKGLQLALAIAVSAVGIFGVTVLALVAWQLTRRKANSVYRDTIYLCLTAGGAVLIEVLTLLWDTLIPHTHFPLFIRVPALVLLVPTMTGTSFRLLYKFVVDVHRDKHASRERIRHTGREVFAVSRTTSPWEL